MDELPACVTGDKAYVSAPWDRSLLTQGIERVLSNRGKRCGLCTWDDPELSYNRRRARRKESHAENFIVFVQVNCILISLKHSF